MQDSKNILWIGTVTDKKHLEQMNTLGGRDSTACNVQEKLITGMEKHGLHIDTISGHVMRAFPKYKKAFIKRRIWHRNDKSLNVDVAIINLPIINRISKTVCLRKEVLSWCKDKENSNIFIYALHTPFLLAAINAKRKYKTIKVFSIVPDLPEYMDSSMGFLKKAAKKADRKLINFLLASVDGYILFSESMKEELPVFHKPYTVVEGIVDIKKEKYFNRLNNREKNSDEKIIMLSGNLAVSDGIEVLLKSFSYIKESNYKLWITGDGKAEVKQMIYDYAERDSRIKYWGYLPSYEALLDLQKKASVFVSMVPSDNSKSKYFFPSKIMEYLATGAPVISFKLGGIPKEYDKFLHYVLEETPAALAKKIEDVCNIPWEHQQKTAIECYELLSQKDAFHQGQKLINLMEDMEKKEKV